GSDDARPCFHAGRRPMTSQALAGGLSVTGPECVKTLSYLACFSPLLLGVAISRLFTTISAGNASERV
ncbi:hypothetical protein, partial [Pseudomonas aeruginosa]